MSREVKIKSIERKQTFFTVNAEDVLTGFTRNLSYPMCMWDSERLWKKAVLAWFDQHFKVQPGEKTFKDKAKKLVGKKIKIK